MQTVLGAAELLVKNSHFFLCEQLQLEYERCAVARKELQKRPKHVVDDSWFTWGRRRAAGVKGYRWYEERLLSIERIN